MIDPEEVREWHLEITSRCTLACPRCPRTIYKGEYEVTDLALEVVHKIINQSNVKNIRKIILCGNHGDPIYHFNFHELIAYLKALEPAPIICINTNGSYRKYDWWLETANIMSRQDQIVFSIDGLQNTNHLYRVNAQWDSIMKAVTACHGKVFLIWKFIVFRYNQHQILAAKKKAHDLGFDEFLLVKSDRFEGKWSASKIDPLKPTIPFDELLEKAINA